MNKLHVNLLNKVIKQEKRKGNNMNKHLIKLALETLLEQAKDANETHKVELIKEEIKLLNI